MLTYSSDRLTRPVTVAGAIRATLTVSTDREDADWVVKLIDVLPDTASPTGGYQMLIRAEVLRGRYRDDPARPRRFVPGRPTQVEIPLLDILHTFEPGHRIMVQIQSSWFPLVDRNPQRWVDNIFDARPEDYLAAMHRVHRGGSRPSRLTFTVLPDR